jgi:predicted NAD/FAD-dependent oxidoreductase
MADLAAGMLELAEQARHPGGAAQGAPALEQLHGRRVATVERRDGVWNLGDAEGGTLAQGRWLVLSGTLLAHPRCQDLLDLREVPLAAANRTLRDPDLERALDAIGGLRYDPRLALLLRIEASQAQPWLVLPFRHLWLSEEARQRWGLERIVLQPLADGRCGVVAHARPADLNACRGSTGADADSQIAALSAALLAALAPWIHLDDLPPSRNRQRMLWGGAFPQPPGLAPETRVCTASQVALCGDAIAGIGFGRIEGAWRSGEWLAARLLPLLSASGG